MDRARLPGATNHPLCHEHPGRTRVPVGGHDGCPVGSLLRQRAPVQGSAGIAAARDDLRRWRRGPAGRPAHGLSQSPRPALLGAQDQERAEQGQKGRSPGRQERPPCHHQRQHPPPGALGRPSLRRQLAEHLFQGRRFPLPGKDGSLEYVRTPAAIWGAEAVIFDEISRCRPDIQNKLFPIVHERRAQGMLLEGLRHRWAWPAPRKLVQPGC